MIGQSNQVRISQIDVTTYKKASPWRHEVKKTKTNSFALPNKFLWETRIDGSKKD